MSSLAAGIAVTLFNANDKAREAGILARANIRIRALDLTIRDWLVRESTRDDSVYVAAPARGYENAKGDRQYFQYLTGDGVQAIKQLILQTYLAQEQPPAPPSAPTRQPRRQPQELELLEDADDIQL